MEGIMKKLKILELFAGVGGLSCGFEQTGRFDIVGAIELEPSIADSFAKNNPNAKVFVGDICRLDIQNIANELNSMKNLINKLVSTNNLIQDLSKTQEGLTTQLKTTGVLRYNADTNTIVKNCEHCNEDVHFSLSDLELANF